MMDQPTAMHVARIKSSHTGKDGQRHDLRAVIDAAGGVPDIPAELTAVGGGYPGKERGI